MRWVCAGCGATYPSVLDEVSPPEIFENVRPAKFVFDRSRLIQPSEAVAEAITKLAGEPYKGPERRAAPRRSFVAEVPVIPVDDHFRPLGDPFLVLTRDISSRGLSFVHNQAIYTKHLVVELPAGSGKGIQVAVEIVRCRAIGSLYEIGGKFVEKFTDQ